MLSAQTAVPRAKKNDALDGMMGQAAEAGSLPVAVGLQVPSTPLGGPLEFAGGAFGSANSRHEYFFRCCALK